MIVPVREGRLGHAADAAPGAGMFHGSCKICRHCDIARPFDAALAALVRRASHLIRIRCGDDLSERISTARKIMGQADIIGLRIALFRLSM
jgi:hypothetical protein